jgi:protein involved in polysaccharide export with SLBB domain
MTRLSVWVLLLVAAPAGALSAQAYWGGGSNYESRALLEGKAVEAENANRPLEAKMLRYRLSTGDFQDGDRIVVLLETNPAASDTMQVQAGRILQFPKMSEVSLNGVLRSELNETLRRHLAKYLTNPNVRAVPLLPVAVAGNVRNPGFFYAPADYLLRDLITRAGGPVPEADVSKTEIRRGGETIWNVHAVRVAFTNGLSLDRLHLRAGDEIFVPARRQRFQMTTVLAMISTAAAAAVSVAVIQQSR